MTILQFLIFWALCLFVVTMVASELVSLGAVEVAILAIVSGAIATLILPSKRGEHA